jgi:peptide/nickel transport system ATP-binding protein
MVGTPVLAIRNYTLDYQVGRRAVPALRAIDLTIGRGELLALVGESGSGKTSLASAIMRMLAPNAVERSGSIRLGNQELIKQPAADMTTIRGRRLGMVFQDPSASLNPTMTLGAQITETLIAHHGLAKTKAWAEGERMLGRVGITDPAAMMRRYPHEASGGEKQRVVIATVFGCRPELILLDEPTTALDVITAKQIIDLLLELQRNTGVAVLHISHDLAVVSQIASRVAVIHRGRIVEQGPIASVFDAPNDAYTIGLLAAVPRPERRLVRDMKDTPAALASLRDMTVRYGRAALFAGLLGPKVIRAIGAKHVSLEIGVGEILGLVGESGSGKSTLARALVGLARFEGEFIFDGQRIVGLKDMGVDYRHDVQIVFQHPDASLNPRHRVREILSRPLKLYGPPDRRSQVQAVSDLLISVRLTPEYADRFPHQLSGGEKQRIAIARAFASRPRLVICDEVTSSLDVSVQAAVIELLVELHQTTGAAYLFISHDINLVRQIAHRIAVMRRGELVEIVEPAELANTGLRQPYTAALLAAVPSLKTTGSAGQCARQNRSFGGW